MDAPLSLSLRQPPPRARASPPVAMADLAVVAPDLRQVDLVLLDLLSRVPTSSPLSTPTGYRMDGAGGGGGGGGQERGKGGGGGKGGK
jgi:hypothetical protein